MSIVMTERRIRLKDRNEKVRAYYKKRFENGYRNDFIIAEMVKMYSLDKCTLEAIVFKKGVYQHF